MQIDLHEFNLTMGDFTLDIDGVSDIGLVVNDLVNYVGNVLQYRLLSILRYLGTDRVANVLNILLEQIPDEINLNDELVLEGGLSKNFKIVDKSYMELPLDVSL